MKKPQYSDYMRLEQGKSVSPAERGDKRNEPQTNLSKKGSGIALSSDELILFKQRIKKSLQDLSLRANEPNLSNSIKNDPNLRELEEVYRDCKNQDLVELQKKITQSIGRRILFLEIQQRKNELEKKKIKKQQIQQSFFRHKKIKKLNYEKLTQDKIIENSYIVRPYNTGKGFIQSDISYRQMDDFHLQRLQDCDFLGTIKQVNQIYIQNYSHYSAHSGKSFENGWIINLAIFLFMIQLTIGMMMIITTYDSLIYIMCTIVGLIVVVLLTHGIRTFRNKPNSNNQLEQTKVDVKEFFQKINAENARKQGGYQWICPEDFMYLEVHFFN